jgi:hypothetical protein
MIPKGEVIWVIILGISVIFKVLADNNKYY